MGLWLSLTWRTRWTSIWSDSFAYAMLSSLLVIFNSCLLYGFAVVLICSFIICITSHATPFVSRATQHETFDPGHYLAWEHISVVTQTSIHNSSKYLNTSGAIFLFQICLASETDMFGCVIVRAGRNIPQATLSVRHARVFAQDGFCLHKICTCHLQRYAPPEWPSDVCDPAYPVSGGLL
jgi:hypothetical protein